MSDEKTTALQSIIIEQHIITSSYLEREVIIDVYLPQSISHFEHAHLLLINDGQDLPKMPFDELLDELITSHQIEPLICVGIHCGAERKREYGTAYSADYKHRGDKAGLYTKF